jgi:predicted regulator of Ras-like GTPase activity (Roadblock/LC7/MglB family)
MNIASKDQGIEYREAHRGKREGRSRVTTTLGRLNGKAVTMPDSPSHHGILEELVKNSQALTALLITKQGTVMASAGETDYLNATAVAALVAGMFTATREVARLVGENQFSILLQQGEMRHIHISLVAGDSMMVVVFEDHNRIGLIRHCARKAADRIGEIALEPASSGEAPGQISLPKFKEYALHLIDRIFEPQPE